MTTGQAVKISVSHYHDRQELSYATFAVTADGLAAARELLATPCANRFRYGLSPWQFGNPWGGDMSRAYSLLEAGNAGGLLGLLAENTKP